MKTLLAILLAILAIITAQAPYPAPYPPPATATPPPGPATTPDIWSSSQTPTAVELLRVSGQPPNPDRAIIITIAAGITLAVAAILWSACVVAGRYDDAQEEVQ